jgi:hypothetical protein
MRGIVLAVALAALPAAATTYADLHTEAMAALDRCESAWFQSRREQAAQEIANVGSQMALRLNPLSESDASMLAEVTEALRRCTEITYGS